MGNSVSFPIDVKHNQVDLPFVATKEQEWLTTQNLTSWEPERSEPTVTCHLEVDSDDGTYLPKSTWNGGQLMTRKTNSAIMVDQTNMDRLRQN